ncbi:BamA/TamA family outer membrane protein [Flammeovirga sp. SubArs3]|uniref:BamA/TamA family outer membrane protein n=1 Tax=Flammeovirga sp. SubArs3 TaxID=2995316 RepID=UPI00248B61DA|nr:BamA/TamA family outer membrane protein [Flammeovirga sp. SubArs3]
MSRFIIYVIGLCFCMTFFEVKAQENKEEKFLIETDTLNLTKSTQIIGLPIIFYTPETSFGAGGGVQFFYLNKINKFNLRQSSMMVDAIYTAKQQLIIDVNPKLFFKEGNYYFDAAFKYKIFPNSFWGVGPDASEDNLEKYNMKTVSLRADILKRLPSSNFNFGVQYRFQKDTFLEKEEGGMMDADTIPGSDGALISGLGFVFNYDDRDNIFSPDKGSYFQVNTWFASLVLGSNTSFNKYIIDLRKYFFLSSKMTIAGRVYVENTYGEVPFQHMAWLGGGDRMRGYFRGRYMDSQLYTVQGEMRYKFHPRWRVNVFGAIGEVGPSFIDLFKGLKVSGGAGLRYKFLKSNDTLLRLDLGINREGGTGVYFGVNEAF